MTSIPNPPKKIKPQGIFLLIFIVMLGIIAAFFLGRLSVAEIPPESKIVFEKAACLVPQELASSDAGQKADTAQKPVAEGAFVGSKSGTKFYPADCSYADRILPQNKVWFATEADAVSAGLTASTQCGSDE